MELKEKHAGLGYTLSAAMPFVFQLIATILAMLIGNIINVSGQELSKTQAFLWVLMFLNQFAFFWTIFFIVNKNKINFVSEFGLKKSGFSKRYLILGLVVTVGLMFLMSPIVSQFVEFLKWLGYTPKPDVFPSEFDVVNYLLGFFILCVLPAIVEETLFRGVVLNGLKGFGRVFAILMSAALFTIMHQSLEQLIHQFIFALVLSYVAISTKSILIPILMHFANNFLAFTLGYVNISELWAYIFMGIGALAVLLCVLYEFVFSKKQREVLVAGGSKKVFFTYAAFGIVFNVVMLVMGTML